MELGLSLGDSSLLKQLASKVPDLSFHIGLCHPSKSTHHQVLEDEDNQDVDIEKHSSQSASSATAASSDLAKYNREYVENKRSLDDHSNENGVTRKKLRLSKQQSALLEESFKEQSSQNPKQKLVLAKQLNLRPRQVEVWFQNRRARTKLKQTEVDCEYFKTYFETLSKENKKLQKEVQELRALRISSPINNVQSPAAAAATTLTMCPSCHQGAAKPTTAASLTPLPPFPQSRSKFYSFSHAPTNPS